MRHLRSDWDGIQDVHQGIADWPSSSIKADEPVFLLRAKDPAAAYAVMAWSDQVEAQGGDPELIKRVRQWAQEMNNWRLDNYPAPKVADVPEGMLR